MERPPERETLYQEIDTELERAYLKHGREPWGRHEFYAILLEEVDELWEQIKQDASGELVLEEMIHVAAMVARYNETRNRYGDGL